MRRQQFHFKYGRLSHGGILRKSRHGRGRRPLSSRDSIHIVFKVNVRALPRGLRHPATFATLHRVNLRYAKRFKISVEQIAVERDHVHILAHAGSRAQFQAYFRVVSGQFAQIVTDTFKRRQCGVRVWKYRPYTRVVRGDRDQRTVRNYIRLNELEASGKIAYRKERLRGISESDLLRLWNTS